MMWKYIFIGVPLLGIAGLMVLLPAYLNCRFIRNLIQKNKRVDVATNGYTFIMPDKCWFGTIKGVLISAGVLIVMLFYFVLVRNLIVTVCGQTSQFHWGKMELSKLIGLVAVTCGIWLLFVFDYLIHRKDHFCLNSEGLNFKLGNQKDSVSWNTIQFVESKKKQYIIHKKSGEEIKINKGVFYNCEQLKKCLEDICQKYPRSHAIHQNFSEPNKIAPDKKVIDKSDL